MGVGKQGSAQITISYDDGPGGTLRAITPYVREIGGIKAEQINQESHPFGVANMANTPVGVQQVPDIAIHGFFDTTATVGPHVVFLTPDSDPNGATRTFTFVAGDSKTFNMETRLKSYEVLGKNGNLTEYEAVIVQAGAGAWS